MIQLSAVIITFNEERNIARCIDSLQGVSDDIIVIDSFSTDKTKEICLSKNVRFIEQQWLGYSETKNLANNYAKHPYILSLDADEALDEALKKSILDVTKQGFEGVYLMNRLTNYCGSWIKYCGWYPDRKIRLFSKDKAKWLGDFVHEELNIESGLKHTILNGNILHYSYYTIKEHQERAKKYALLGAKKYQQQNKKSSHIKAIISTIFKFTKVYLIQLGFVDGKAGWYIATISAFENYTKYKELARLNSLAKK